MLLGLFALLGEWAAREAAQRDAYLDERMLRYDSYSIRVEPHGEYGFRQKPNQYFRYADHKGATSNGQGFRGPEVGIPKPEARLRVVLLGGSPAHGWGSNDDETIDAYMREIYQTRGRTRIDVVNLAMDAYDSWQVFERLRSEVSSHVPDVVIVNAGVVDVGHGRLADLQTPDRRTLFWEGTLGPIRNGAPLGFSADLKHASRLVQFVLLKQHEWATGVPRGAELKIEVEVLPDAVVYFGSNLRRIADLCDEIGAALLLSTSPSGISALHEPGDVRPYGFWLGSAEETERYRLLLADQMAQAASEAWQRGRRVKYLRPTVEPGLFLDDAHLLPEGNRSLASQFVQAIEPWVRRAPENEATAP